jgi:outer membrane biosynthesis protein TonB
MNPFARATLTVTILSLGLGLSACSSMDNFDPTDIFNSEIFSTKKKLPGERRAVFPEGTPGVPQGVPAELIKGNQAAAEPEVTQSVPPKKEASAEEKAQPKPKPKPKVVAKPPEPEGRPTSVTVRRSEAESTEASAQPQPQSGWPAAQRGGSIWPDPPR